MKINRMATPSISALSCTILRNANLQYAIKKKLAFVEQMQASVLLSTYCCSNQATAFATVSPDTWAMVRLVSSCHAVATLGNFGSSPIHNW